MMRASAQEVNAYNYKMMQEANKFSAGQAQKQMDFQEYMSSTAHQREVNDLMAAGLNPILSATGGQGAPMASGAMGQAYMARGERGLTENPMKDIAQSALAAKRFKELELKSLEQNIKQTDSNIKVANSTMDLQNAQILKAAEEMATLQSSARLNSAAAVREMATAGAQSAYAALMDTQRQGANYDNMIKATTMPDIVAQAKSTANKSFWSGKSAEEQWLMDKYNAREATNKHLNVTNTPIGEKWLPWFKELNPLTNMFKFTTIAK